MFLLQVFSDGSLLRSMLIFIPVILIFWFLVISPQKKEEKKKKELLKSLKKGDRVITIGGILGVVSKTSEKNVVLKLARDIEVKFLKSAIEKLALEEEDS